MITHRYRLSALAFGIAMLLASISASVDAQTESPVIRLTVGEVLEITTDTASPHAQFNWILTKDRTFQSAARTRFFQTRLAEPGTYVLDVSIQDPVVGTNEYRAFTLVVSEGQAPPLPQRNEDEKPQALLRTDRSANTTSAGLPEEGGLLKIDPSLSLGRIEKFSLDLDSTIDSNGDGNPKNDADTAGTSFEKIGSPLFLYMLPRVGRDLTLTVSNNRGDPESSVSLAVLFGVSISSETTGSEQHAGPIAVQNNKGKLTFSVGLDPAQVGERELLYEWDFGDRTRSLLTKPQHQYSAAGTYAVSVRIRDIMTAEVLFSSTQNVVIDQSSIAVASSSAAAENTAGTTAGNETPETGSSSFSLWGILKVLFIVMLILGFALSLYALLVWLKGKTTKNLQQTLEKMEGTIVEKKEEGKSNVQPDVMKLTKAPSTPKKATVLSQEEVIENEQAHTEFKNTIDTTPTTSAGPVPDWLNATPKIEKKEAAKPALPSVVPPRTPAPTPAVAAPTPPVTPQVVAVNDGPVPAWLQKPSASTTPPKPVVPPPVTPPGPAPVQPLTPSKPSTPQAPKPAQPLVPPPKVPEAPTPQSILPPEPPKAPEVKAPQEPIAQPIKNVEPDATPKPATDQNDNDPTIAIIKADSLNT